MKSIKILFLSLMICSVSAFAVKGDSFLDVAPAISFVGQSNLKQPNYGLSLGYMFGVNDRTDLSIYGDVYIGQSDFVGVEKYLSTSVGFRSYFTPYYGDIRPMFGLGMGMSYQKQGKLIDNALFKASAHARILYDASDVIKVFTEFEPSIYIGTDPHMDFAIHIGAQLRLGS